MCASADAGSSRPGGEASGAADDFAPGYHVVWGAKIRFARAKAVICRRDANFGTPQGGERLLLGPQLPPGLPELLFHLRAREIAAERRVHDAVVAGELPQRLAARPPPQQVDDSREMV